MWIPAHTLVTIVVSPLKITKKKFYKIYLNILKWDSDKISYLVGVQCPELGKKYVAEAEVNKSTKGE